MLLYVCLYDIISVYNIIYIRLYTHCQNINVYSKDCYRTIVYYMYNVAYEGPCVATSVDQRMLICKSQVSASDIYVMYILYVGMIHVITVLSCHLFFPKGFLACCLCNDFLSRV